MDKQETRRNGAGCRPLSHGAMLLLVLLALAVPGLAVPGLAVPGLAVTGQAAAATGETEGRKYLGLDAFAAFERAKEIGGPFGGTIAGLPKDVCLGDRVPDHRYRWGEGLPGIPIFLGRRDLSQGLAGVGEDKSLFRICRPFNTGLDD